MYHLQDMTGTRAVMILRDLLDVLARIEPEHMTTLEFELLKRVATNPPLTGGGAEKRLRYGTEP